MRSRKARYIDKKSQALPEYGVSVIIPTFDAGNVIALLLSALKNQRKCDVQLIVVDAGSKDSTCKIAQSFGAETVSIDKREFSVAFACNKGLSKAARGLALFMAQDALPSDEYWLWRICEQFKHGRCAAMGVSQAPCSEAELVAKWIDASLPTQTSGADGGIPPKPVLNRGNSPLCNVACLYDVSALRARGGFRKNREADIAVGKVLFDKPRNVARINASSPVHLRRRTNSPRFSKAFSGTHAHLQLGMMEFRGDVSWHEHTIAGRDAELAVKAARIKQLEDALHVTTLDLIKQRQLTGELLNSTSWRYTALLRAIFKGLRDAKGVCVQGLKRLAGYLPYPLARCLTDSTYRDKVRCYLQTYGVWHLIKIAFNRCMLKLKLQKPSTVKKTYLDEVSPLEQEKEEHVHSVSVIVPTLNAGQDISFLLNTMKRQRKCDVQLIIVDSGSTDGTCRVAENYGAEIIPIPKEEFSHSHARNLGVEKAKHELCLLIVQDAMPTDDLWLYKFCEIFKKSGCAAMSCVQIPRTNADLMACWGIRGFNEFCGFPSTGADTTICSTSLSGDQTSQRIQSQIDNVSCLYKTDIIRREKFKGNYGEDIEMGKRLLSKKFCVGKTSEVKVIHSHRRMPAYYFKRTIVDVGTLLNLYLHPLAPGMTWKSYADDCAKGVVYSGALLAVLDRIGANVPLCGFQERLLDSCAPVSYQDAIKRIGALDQPFAKMIGEVFDAPAGGLDAAFERGNLSSHIRYALKNLLDGFVCISYEHMDAGLSSDIRSFILQTLATHMGVGVAQLSALNRIPSAKTEIIQGLRKGV